MHWLILNSSLIEVSVQAWQDFIFHRDVVSRCVQWSLWLCTYSIGLLHHLWMRNNWCEQVGDCFLSHRLTWRAFCIARILAKDSIGNYLTDVVGSFFNNLLQALIEFFISYWISSVCEPSRTNWQSWLDFWGRKLLGKTGESSILIGGCETYRVSIFIRAVIRVSDVLV